jgi:hypothetical protein
MPEQFDCEVKLDEIYTTVALMDSRMVIEESGITRKVNAPRLSDCGV